MGVDRVDYIMWGAEIGYDQIDYDRDIAEIERRPQQAEFDLVVDFMSGQYSVAGLILIKADDYAGFPLTDFTEHMQSVQDLMAVSNRVIARFPDLNHSDFGFKVFSHFS